MGLWIEIPIPHLCSVSYRRQPLRWGCGLKSDSSVIIENSNLSASAMGLWIEITQTITWWSKALSASAMGLWIEMYGIYLSDRDLNVSLCDGAVD